MVDASLSGAKAAGRLTGLDGVTVLHAEPVVGGVAAVARAVDREWSERGVAVRAVELPRPGVPVWTALRAFLREWRHLRSAERVVVEFGLLDTAVFWFALFAVLTRRDVVVIGHDAPRLALAPGAGLVGRGARGRDIIGHRLLAPVLDRRLRAVVNRRLGAGVVFGEAARSEWLAEGAERVVTIDLGADPPTEGGVPPSRGEHVLFAGYLGPAKGIEVLLDAWQEIGACSALPLVIAGGTNGDSDYLLHVSERLRTLPGPPLLLGEVDDVEFARLFATAAVVVLPYLRSNPASGVLVRAMVEGRAIVASRVPATVSQIDDGCGGLLVDPGDAEALARALEKVIGSPELRDRLGAAAAKLAGERFTWDRHLLGLEVPFADARKR